MENLLESIIHILKLGAVPITIIILMIILKVLGKNSGKGNENIMSDKTKRALEYFKKTLGEDSEEYKLLKKVLLQEENDENK